MASQWSVEVARRAPVAQSPERAVAMKMPAAISARLDVLVRKTEVVRVVDGERVVERGTTRKELIAAMICDTPINKRELDAKLARYRKAKVGAAVPGTQGDRITLPGHRPGPRPTSATPDD